RESGKAAWGGAGSLVSVHLHDSNLGGGGVLILVESRVRERQGRIFRSGPDPGECTAARTAFEGQHRLVQGGEAPGRVLSGGGQQNRRFPRLVVGDYHQIVLSVLDLYRVAAGAHHFAAGAEREGDVGAVLLRGSNARSDCQRGG